MPEQDTPSTAPGDRIPRRPPLPTPPTLPELDPEQRRRRAELAPYLAMLDKEIAEKSAAVWDSKRWGGCFLDDLTSSATGEPCWARAEMTHFGEHRALIELRPGLPKGYAIQHEGPEPMWWVTIGRRKPQRFVFLHAALNNVMDRPAKNWTEWSIVRSEWFRHGDLRLLAKLYAIQMDTGAN
jgi:hypothetical protein